MPVKLQVSSAQLLETKADLIVFGVFEGDPANDASLASLHKELGVELAALLARDDFRGRKDQRALVSTLGRIPAHKVLLLGLGKADAYTEAGARVFAANAARTALGEKAASLAIQVPEVSGAKAATWIRPISEGVVLGSYRFTRYFTGERRPKVELAKTTVHVAGAKRKVSEAETNAAALGVAIGEAVCVARDLQNEPPNEMTPVALADAAVSVAKTHGLKATVLDRKGLERAGMKLFVAVGQGSANEPRLAHIVYAPKKKAKKKIVFVGKGLTFDSGGLCIKPAPGMEEMKMDMSGAANVVALMAAIASIKPDVEVHGIIGCAENMPDGAAYRPSDIFGSLDGKTVEIINTDAEGRLVLADCLTYAKNLKPDVIIDNATLTGACVVALGQTCSGFYTGSDALAEAFAGAAKEAGEQFWRLPLLEDLREALKSDSADLKHTGDRWGGSITAALFLREFVGDVPWIHCDIAGPSISHRAYNIYSKGGTGHAVLTFLRFIENGRFG
jgi:leucyl aminopeptidase